MGHITAGHTNPLSSTERRKEGKFYSDAVEEIKFFLRDNPEATKFLLENDGMLLETIKILHSNRPDIPFNECAEKCQPIYENCSIYTVRSYNQFLRTAVDNEILLTDDIIDDLAVVSGQAEKK